VIIWLDAQISPDLAGWIKTTFGVECLHVRDLGLRNAEDPEMKNPAANSGVSKAHPTNVSDTVTPECFNRGSRSGFAWIPA
jgi:hypothetical protein